MDTHTRDSIIHLYNRWVDERQEHLNAEAEALGKGHDVSAAGYRIRASMCASHATELRDMLGKLLPGESCGGLVTDVMIGDEIRALKDEIRARFPSVSSMDICWNLDDYLWDERERLREEAIRRLHKRILKPLV
jgi:hypothetical protein